MRFRCFGEICIGNNEVVPLGRIDKEAILFFKVRKIYDKAMWVLGENPQQAFGFIPKWICPKTKKVGVAVRDDRANKGNLYGLCHFIYTKHGYKVEYQISPRQDVQKMIDLYFPEKIPKPG